MKTQCGQLGKTCETHMCNKHMEQQCETKCEQQLWKPVWTNNVNTSSEKHADKKLYTNVEQHMWKQMDNANDEFEKDQCVHTMCNTQMKTKVNKMWQQCTTNKW